MFLSIRDCMVMGEEYSTPIEGLRMLGVDAIEIELKGDFTVAALDTPERAPLNNAADCRAYRAHLDGLGIHPCAFLTACDFSVGAMADNIAWVAQALRLADLIGVPVLRIDAHMSRERELTFAERVSIFAEGLGGALELTPDSPIAMGIENHGFQGNNLAFLLNVIQKVGSPRLGMTLDTGNFYWRGYPLSEVYGIISVLAPFAKHTHMKNIRYPEDIRETVREGGFEYGRYVAPLYEGDIDHGHVFKILRAAGYEGDLCIEDESLHNYPLPERAAILKRDVEHVLALISALGV